MIDKTNIIPTVLARLDKLPVGHALDLRTYKRNRSVVIHKISEQELTVIEDGFGQETFDISPDKLPKLLKTLLRREFPRSTKVRLYDLGPYEPGQTAPARKKI